jgi:CO/xanthine dehydrogenase Mo-binding subunit
VSRAVVTAEADGTFTVLSPTVDVGTGTHTLVQQIVATEMQEQQGTQCLVLG